jgi:VWFA-related protein
MKLCVALVLASLSTALAQNLGQNSARPTVLQNPRLTSEAPLVLVPALVRDKSGELVFTLTDDDFFLTDDGVPQKLTLEQDTGGEPLALVIDIEGQHSDNPHQRGAASKPDRYRAIAPMLDALIGGVEHKVAVVGFNSSPVLVQDFTPNTDAAARAVQVLIADDRGDNGSAILDSIGLSVDLLRKQPPQYRRAILLVSETTDRGSKLSLDGALRAISDTNTAIYSVAFSSAKDYMKREGPKTLGRGPIPFLSSKEPVSPGPAHGCMSRDPNDPQVDLSKNVAAQAYDCLSILAPPLRLAKIAAIAATDGLRKNAPETIAHLTGGEYFKLTDEKSLEHDLNEISNHIPNRYILSFQPQSPHAGFHALTLRVPNYANLEVTARSSYWADTQDASPAQPENRSK